MKKGIILGVMCAVMSISGVMAQSIREGEMAVVYRSEERRVGKEC